MMYAMEMVQTTTSYLKTLEVTEMNMCKWVCGHTLRYHVRNYNTRERLQVENITKRYRKARLRSDPTIKWERLEEFRLYSLDV